MSKTLIVLGEHNPAWETHAATNAAIEHSSELIGQSLAFKWRSTSNITRSEIESADGFWIATGAPYDSLDTALDTIRYAREHSVPCLGTCQGFQHIMLEYARAFLGIQHPGHAEYNNSLERPFISELSCSLRGTEAEIKLSEGSQAFNSYGSSRTTERFYCRFGISPYYISDVKAGPIRISGVDINDEIRIVEYTEHPFMIGTLFVPQARSQEGMPHPLITAFILAICTSSQGPLLKR